MRGFAVARSELILGGQRSGKSRRAELLAAEWLAADAGHRAVFIVTAQAGDDDEMNARIERHRADRAERLPRAETIEAPVALAEAVARHASPASLLVVDCLTLWLVNRYPVDTVAMEAEAENLVLAIGAASGPVVLVTNEIGLGVVPMGREVRAYVDALGRLNQRVASACTRVTLVAAGLPLTLKDSA